jgi:hypothetical protein
MWYSSETKIRSFSSPHMHGGLQDNTHWYFQWIVLLGPSVICTPRKKIKEVEKFSRRSNSVLITSSKLPSSPASIVFQLRPRPMPLLVVIYVTCASLLSSSHDNRLRWAPSFHCARLKIGPMVRILFPCMLLTFLPSVIP